MKKSIKQSTLMLLLNVVSILLALIVAVTFFLVITYNQNIITASTEKYDLTENAKRFINGSISLTNEVRSYAATGNRIHYDNYWNEINTLKNRDIGLSNMQSIGITEQELEVINNMSSLSNNLVPLEEKAMDLVDVSNKQDALEIVYGLEYEESLLKISQLQNDFLSMLETRMQNRIITLNQIITNLKLLAYTFIILVVLLQIITIFITRKHIINPIIAIQNEMSEIAKGNLSSNFLLEPNTSEIGILTYGMIQTKKELKKYINDIKDKMSQIAQGNMDISVDIEYIGDFQAIKESIVTIVNSLNYTLNNINQSADLVANNSEQISNNAQSFSQGILKQSHSIEELFNTITEISSNINENAKKAVIANKLSDEANVDVIESNQKMQDMIASMAEISGKSNQINKIIKTIDDIAFQTNILALNAAVEAARAGDAGKGFAVVADEVRNLAQKSAEAVNDTTELIESTIKAVGQGVKIADDTAHSLSVVVEKVTHVGNVILEISDTSIHQATGATQISKGIESISVVVKANSITTEQSVATSEELDSQAQLLKELVKQFKLKDTTSNLIVENNNTD